MARRKRGLVSAQRLLEGGLAADDREPDARSREIDGELGPGLGLERELRVAGEDHQAKLLARRHDLVIGHEPKGEVHVLAGDERGALGH